MSEEVQVKIESADPNVAVGPAIRATCGNCRFAKMVPQDMTKRFCWGGPPSVIGIPSPQGIMAQSVRPIVDAKDDACSIHPRYKDNGPGVFAVRRPIGSCV